MADAAQRLRGLDRTIENICTQSGAAGALYGALHKNEVIHLGNSGFRDGEQQLPPDENTVYHLASLTKSFTATAVSHLVS